MIDLREHIEELKGHGELLTIEDEVDFDLEAAAIAAMANRTGAQAIHFKKVKEYPKGYTLAANLLSGPGHYLLLHNKRTMWGRMAIALSMDPKVDYESFIAAINDRFDNPIMPVKLSTGSCKEKIIKGKEVNLYDFPFPILHKEDGGRYGTAGVLITKDPESDWQNWGIYRFMIIDKNKIVSDFLTQPSLSSDTRGIYEKYKAMGKPMPFAISFGGAPAIMMAAATRLPPGMSEAEHAGGLNLDPINLVQAETSEILVPADAEMIIEGEVSLTEMVDEGPYGTIKGYSIINPRPVMRVSAITHRKDAILPFIVDGTKVSDTQAIISITESARIYRYLTREAQQPLRWLQIPADFNLSFCVASIFNPIHGIPTRMARHIFATTNLFDKVVFVDADILPTSLVQVHIDVGSKVNADRGINVLYGYPQAVMPNYGTKTPEQGYTRMYVDACWPAYWKSEERPTPMTLENIFPESIQRRIVERWKELGIPEQPVLYPVLPGIGQQR